MRHPIRNTISVLAATLFTALAVYGGVQFTQNVVAPTSSDVAMTTQSAAVAGTETLTCPATGCTASTCHATRGGRH